MNRIGSEHQAGSDSLLTCVTFFKLRKVYTHQMDDKQFLGVLYGLGTGCVGPADAPPAYTPGYMTGSSGQGGPGSAIEATS